METASQQSPGSIICYKFLVPSPVFLPGKSHEWRSLVGYSLCGRKESDTTERLHFHCRWLYGIPRCIVVMNPPSAGDICLIPGSGRSPGDEMATLLNIPALEVSWTEELGGLQSIWLQKVIHN